MSDNDWVTLALTDTTLVADLLLRMRSSTTKTPAAVALPPLEWSVRQRRSRSVTITKHGNTISESKKNTGGSTRASPSTPLSWSSGGVGGGECCDEDSSKLKLKLKELVVPRSKAPVTCETSTTNTKRSRKKKTLAELKVEESLLLNEKRQLKNELAFMRIAFEKQIATNQRLKRMKLDLPTQQTGQSSSSSKVAIKACLDQTQQTNSACGPSTVLPTDVARNVGDDVAQTSPSNAPSKVQDTERDEAAFLLPDLNMPAGEDASSVIFSEVS